MPRPFFMAVSWLSLALGAASFSSPLIYVASAAKLGRTTEEYRRILREDDVTIRGAQ
jgi:hypothetical protein